MPDQTYIAVLHKDNDSQPFALQSLVDSIEVHEDLKLDKATDKRVRFSGKKDVIDRVTQHFQGRVLIEEDQDLTLDDPTPQAAAVAETSATDAAPDDQTEGDDTPDDDKDPNEIVQF